MAGDTKKKQERLEMADELFTILIRTLKERISSGAATAAEMSVAAKILHDGGFRVDPNDIPKDIKDKLTEHISAKDLQPGDPDVPEGFVQ